MLGKTALMWLTQLKVVFFPQTVEMCPRKGNCPLYIWSLLNLLQEIL